MSLLSQDIQAIIKQIENGTNQLYSNIKAELLIKAKIDFGVARFEYKNLTIMYTSNKNYGSDGSGFYLIISNVSASQSKIFGSRKEFKIPNNI